jgi:glycosyltransferase EpsD
MKKVLFTATVVKTHINVFHIPYLKMMRNMGYKTYVAAKNDFENETCVIPYCDDFTDIEFRRNPFSATNLKAYKKLRELIERERFDLIHCHTPVASILTRVASISARKKYGTKVIYTAHGFHFFKGAPLKNWLLYYPVEKICSYFTDVLITINREDYALAKRKMKAKRIEYVPGVGLEMQKFTNTVVDRAAKRRELSIPEDAMVLISVGELNHNKNHEVVIKALAQFIQEDLHYLIAGGGYLLAHLQSMAEELGIADRVHFLGYRNDIAGLYIASDICVFPSMREGLPVALMEAMACGMPVVCSNIRGNTDLIDEKGGVLFEPTDIDACRSALEKVIENEELRKSMEEWNAEQVKRYDCSVVNAQIKQIYENALNIKRDAGK